MPCGGLSRLLLAAAASGAAASAPPFQAAAEPFRRLQDAEKGERCMSGLKGDFGYKTCGEFCKEMKKTNHCKFCKCQVRPRVLARSSQFRTTRHCHPLAGLRLLQGHRDAVRHHRREKAAGIAARQRRDGIFQW